MRKFTRVLMVVAAIAVLVSSCRLFNPPDEEENGDTGPSLVTVGDSITMGIQDAGLKYDFQINNYPYYIARQLEIEGAFRQPYLKQESPGIASPPYKEPLSLSGGEIGAELWPDGTTDEEIVDYMINQVETSTLVAQGRFHNLGVSGARLFDIRTTTGADSSQDGNNVFFELVLLNDGTSRTIATQVAAMSPDYIILWIGNNDILHVVLDGAGVDGAHFDASSESGLPPTPVDDFEAEYAAVLDAMLAVTSDVVVSTLPAHLPYVSALDGIYQTDNLLGPAPPSGGALCVFDPSTFEPIDFSDGSGDPEYLPLRLEEEDATHLLLSGAIAYMDLEDEDGDGEADAVGLPAAGTLGTDYGLDPATIAAIELVYDGLGLTPADVKLEGNLTLTDAEVAEAERFIADYNEAIERVAGVRGVRVVDMGAEWWSETQNFGGYSGRHALQDQGTTTFSLDGVHPNNLGHALSANAFIEAMNAEFGLSIPALSPDDYAGQYTGASIRGRSLRSLRGVRDQWQ